MKAVTSISAAALAFSLGAVPASAQVAGLPVNYAPVGTGVTVHGQFGRGLNDDSGKDNSFGGGVTLGLPSFQVGAAASYFDVGGDFPTEKVSFGGHAAYRVPLGPATPVNLAVIAGVGFLDLDGGSTLFVPAGVTIGIDVPSPSLNITPWVSPQFRWTQLSPDVGDSESEASFGASGGVSLGLPVGVGFDVLLDYNRVPENAFGGTSAALNQILFGVGAHYRITVPSLGGM